MALVLADRVQETTTTTGTGTITLAGAVSGYQSFAAVGNANTCYYTIAGGTEWEVGIGTYTSAGTTLSRDTVLSSSNAGALVDFSAGTKNVFCDYPAGKAVYADASGNVLVSSYTAALNTSAPNATVYAASFTATGAATNIDAVIAPKGTGAVLAQVPDSATTGGNKRGARAVDFQTQRNGATQVASGTSSAVLQGINCTASGNYAIVAGVSSSATGEGSACLGGGIVSGNIAGNTASASAATVIGGGDNQANAVASIVLGGQGGRTRSIIGNFTTPASNAPLNVGSGATQTARLVLARATTDATPTVLASNPSAAGTTNQVILPNNSAYIFEGKIIANVTGGGNTSGWTFTGVIKRGANAASTALVAAVTPTLVAQDAGASTWAVAVAADTTNGGLKVTVTGQAATTIRWVCHIETTEVTF